jgi:hypothetical protein
MGYSYAYEIEEMIELGLLPVLFSSVPSMAFGIAVYVLTALAFYTVADRRGLKNPWLAWIPVANLWLLGSISDQYRYVVKGEFKSKRKILLMLGIASMVVGMVIFGLITSLAITGISGAMGGISEEQMVSQLMGRAIGMVGLFVPMMGIAIAQMVIRYMALYDVYKSMDPSNCVMFLVLSILFNFTEPFFLFFNRNKDEGMPPRRQQPVYEQPVYQAPQEPWNQNGPDYL